MINLVQKNLPAKIIALLVAIVLWFFVMSDQNPSMDSSFSIPVDIVNAPDGYKISRNVDTVTLKVRGARSLFATTSASDLKAYVDLKGITEGRHAVKIQSVLPPGFELLETSPETIAFAIDKIIQKQIPVELAVAGAPETGTTVGKVLPSVQSVTIEGPSSFIDTVTRVIANVNVAGNRSDFSVTVPLTAVNADGKEVESVKIMPQSVDVVVAIVKGVAKKMVGVKPVLGSDLPANYVVNGMKFDPTKIEITGDQKLIDPINFIETEKISLADIIKPVKKDVKLVLPAGITVTNDTITVTIDVAEKK
ncbi:YbbR domain-containing protein [Propionispira arboris]|uniref:YbbR domain-containing protein n=1 Tax=Propionispira arboris TaxID=84035 RepID=A0A1H6Y957_9FIRM|nr:CdaR family protein [Propionispira arboris]SEJ33670.1 YbbR domain-containing protein [Propionispira arboris]